SADPRHPLQRREIPALVHLPPVERLRLPEHHVLPLGPIHLQERPALGEERGLARPGDDHVEVVPPRRVLAYHSVQQEGHHHVGVVPERVGEQEELLSARAQLVQCRPQLWVAEDVPADVLAPLALQGVIAMDRIDRLPDVVVQLPVLHRLPLPLQQLDDRRVEPGLGEREERVDPGVPLAGEADPLVPVEAGGHTPPPPPPPPPTPPPPPPPPPPLSVPP